jgi:hypothetical protein
MKLSEKMRARFGWKGLQSIEFRILYWAWRAILAVTFAFYLCLSAKGAWTWTQVKFVRLQDVSQMPRVLSQSFARGDAAWAESWITYRPLSDSGAMMKRLDPYTPAFSPFVFFNLARRARYLGDAGETRFWSMLARYRLRYDILRCGGADTAEDVAMLTRVFSSLDPGFSESIPPGDEVAAVRRVLDFDAQYPAADDPDKICRILGLLRQKNFTPVPQDRWDAIRFGLRHATDRMLRRAGEGGK